LEEFDGLLEMLFDVLLLKGLFFLFERGVGLRTFLELQQTFVVFADLLGHHYLLALAFLLNLRQDVLPRV
jgi:hypothetical protein